MDNKTLAIIALVLAFFIPIAGLILGIITLARISNSADKEGKGLAIAAIVISATIFVLIWLIVIGALAFFGVLAPSTLIPESCTFTVGVSCIDFTVSQNSISLIILNGAGRDMIINSIEYSGEDVVGSCIAESEKMLRNGERGQFDTENCNIQTSGETSLINARINYVWEDSPTIKHILSGQIRTRVS